MLALLLAAATSVASAQERAHRPAAQHGEQRAPEQRQGDARDSVLRLLPANSVTEHTVSVPGRKLDYIATAGTLALFDQSGERSALVYYTAYVAKDADPNRPVTFGFNGGPAQHRRFSISAWSVRGSPNSSATTRRRHGCGTIRRPGWRSPIWS